MTGTASSGGAAATTAITPEEVLVELSDHLLEVVLLSLVLHLLHSLVSLAFDYGLHIRITGARGGGSGLTAAVAISVASAVRRLDADTGLVIIPVPVALSNFWIGMLKTII
jgi:hypothetical protein